MDKNTYCIARKSCVVQRSMQEFNRSWSGILLLSLYEQISSILLLWREILSAASRPRLFLCAPRGISILRLALGLTGIPRMHYHGRLCENRFRTAFPHENLLCQAG